MSPLPSQSNLLSHFWTSCSVSQSCRGWQTQKSCNNMPAPVYVLQCMACWGRLPTWCFVTLSLPPSVLCSSVLSSALSITPSLQGRA